MLALHKQLVQIQSGGVVIEGALELPEQAIGMVLFAHGSGSSRFSRRNNYVADVLHKVRIGTLLIDLLTPQEDSDYRTRFDIDLLSLRLESAFDWLRKFEKTSQLPLGIFGASTGAAAALRLSSKKGREVAAVVSRGGRPDLAGVDALEKQKAPTLLIVGGDDEVVVGLNRNAYASLHCAKQLEIIPGATHLFEEPGKLDAVARLATDWFRHYLQDRIGKDKN
jgi:pimeloyl-ACP methyl ester carboxylesterase